MAKQLTAEDVRVSLNAHVASRGEEIHAKYGPVIGWAELQQMLEDRTCVRYPCKLEFNAAPLQPGEFAHPVAQGDKPEDGYIMYVHPLYMTQLADVPALVCYQLVLVNYGEFAASEDAPDVRRRGARDLGGCLLRAPLRADGPARRRHRARRLQLRLSDPFLKSALPDRM